MVNFLETCFKFVDFQETYVLLVDLKEICLSCRFTEGFFILVDFQKYYLIFVNFSETCFILKDFQETYVNTNVKLKMIVLKLDIFATMFTDLSSNASRYDEFKGSVCFLDIR